MSKWSSLKFKIAEDLGECMDCTYIKHDPKLLTNQFTIYNHQFHDGISGITDFLKRDGFEVKQQPQLRDSNDPPNLLKKIVCLIGYIKLTRPVEFKWKKKKVDMTGSSKGFSFSYLDRSETGKVKEYCKTNKISLTVLMLASLDKVVAATLLESGSVRKWVSPINMRGGVVKGNRSGNYSASIIIDADDSFDEKKWQQEFRSYLKNKKHWGAWLYTNMARLLGESGSRYMVKKLKNLAVGVVSNMGEWPTEGYTAPEGYNENFVITPSAPASQLLPLAAVSTIWYGRLALTLRVHPSLQMSINECEQLHNDWNKEICDRVNIPFSKCDFITRDIEYS